LGSLFVQTGRMAEAEEPYRQAVKIGKKLVAEAPDEPAYRNELADYRCSLAGLLIETGRSPDEAEQLLRQTLDDVQISMKQFKGQLNYRDQKGRVHRGLGNLYWRAGRVEEAKEQFGEYIGIVEGLVKDCPTVAAYKTELARFLSTGPDSRLRDSARAVALAKEAVDLAPEYLLNHMVLGIAHYRAGNYPACIAALEKTTQEAQSVWVGGWFFLAMAHWKTDNPALARRYYDRVVEYLETKKLLSEELRRFREEADQVKGSRDGRRP
jgi:tetratricopeptide (TPR) repeat protein